MSIPVTLIPPASRPRRRSARRIGPTAVAGACALCVLQAQAQTQTQTAPAAPAPVSGAASAVPTLPNGGTLRTITVTATKTERDVRTAPASVTVIGSDEIAARNAVDLLEAVRGAPGLNVTSRQVGGRKTLALRGLEGKHTLTLIDGRRISASDDVIGHSDYQYGWMPMSAVERIEIIRGPMSALYGSEALGGVINLISRRPTDRWIGSVGLSAVDPTTAGEGGRVGNASVFATGPVGEGLVLRAHLDGVKSGTVAEKEDPRYSEIEGRHTISGSLAAIVKVGRDHEVELGHSEIDEERYYDSVSGTKAYRNTYDIGRRQTHFDWRGVFGTVKSSLRAYRSEMSVSNSRTNGVTPTRPQNMTDDVLDGHVTVPMGDHRLTLGGEVRKETLVNSGLKGGSDDASHKALFVQDEWALSEAWMLTAGVRNDRHQLFGSETSPRAYLVWQASPAWVVKGGFGHAFKAPTLKQISPNYVGAEGPHTFLGNGDVRPESSNSFELAADGQLGAWGVRAALYQTDVKDLITYRLVSQSGTRATYQYDNVDRARIRGLESGVTWAFAPRWQWSLDLNLLDTEDKSTGKDLAERPKYSGTTRLQWRGASGLDARLDVQYTGTQMATGGGDLPAYSLINVSLGQSWPMGAGRQMRLRAGMDNVGNVRLAEKSADFGWAERGRRLFVNARMDF